MQIFRQKKASKTVFFKKKSSKCVFVESLKQSIIDVYVESKNSLRIPSLVSFHWFVIFYCSTTIIIGARCSTKLDWCPVSAWGYAMQSAAAATQKNGGSHSCEEPRAHRGAFLGGSFEAAGVGNMFHRCGFQWQKRVRQKLQILKESSHNHLDWLQQNISILLIELIVQ